MFYRVFSAFIIAFVLAAAPVLAQNNQSPTGTAGQAEVITFEDAVRIALDHSIEIRRALQTLQSSGVEVSSSRAAFLPNLNAQFNGRQDYGTSFNETVGGFISETTQGASGSISTSVNLIGYGNFSRLRGAQYDYRSSEHDLRRARENVVFQVMDRYLALVEARENVRIQEENVETARRQLEQIEEFVRVGTQPRSDLYTQQAEAASAEFDLLEAERVAQVSEMQLIELLQLDPRGAYEFEVPDVDDTSLTPQEYDVATLIDEALARRADLRAQEAAISASEFSVRQARSGYLPSISIGARTGSSYSSALDFSFSDQFFENRRSESLSFSISIPVFDRFQTRSQVRQARLQAEGARLQLAELEQQVAVQVRQAYLDYQSAQKRLEVARAQVEAAELSLEAAQERYNVGAATLVEVSQAQANYVQANSNFVQAQYDLIFQQRRIDYEVGLLNTDQPLFR